MLAEGGGKLRQLREGAAQAERTLAGLKRQLPPELAARVWGALLKEGTLTLLVGSAAWGTRLRYHVPRIHDALAAELGAAVLRVKVKVRAQAPVRP